MKQNIAITLQHFLNENNAINTKFYPVPDDIFDIMKRKRYSDEVNRKHMSVFIGKDKNEYLIIKSIDSDNFNVYSINDIKNMVLNNLPTYPDRIAHAAFIVKYEEKYFTGYSSVESINVDFKFRRLGIATAIIDFVEQYYNMEYIHSRTLTSDMQEFVKKRFNLNKIY